MAQINCVVGDVAGNARLLREAALTARAAGADILVAPELALCGYPPEDLLTREDFYRACERALIELARDTRGIDVLVGHPELAESGCHNAASLLRDGKVLHTYHKWRLLNYEVFDEVRYFRAGR